MTAWTVDQNGPAVIYSIDQDDRIVHVNDAWGRFALDNDTEHLEREAVFKRSLWDFIADIETRHVHRVMATRVREKQTTLAFPFRCDSPSIRRYMRMQVIPGPDGGIVYRCTAERIEHRAPVSLLERKAWRDERVLRMCSWCKKVDLGGQIWVEVEAAVQQLRLLERKSLPEIAHTMCDGCLDNVEV